MTWATDLRRPRPNRIHLNAAINVFAKARQSNVHLRGTWLVDGLDIHFYTHTNTHTHIYILHIYIYLIIEGSLEVKLPTIWTDEKQSREEAERGERLEERRVEEKE